MAGPDGAVIATAAHAETGRSGVWRERRGRRARGRQLRLTRSRGAAGDLERAVTWLASRVGGPGRSAGKSLGPASIAKSARGRHCSAFGCSPPRSLRAEAHSQGPPRAPRLAVSSACPLRQPRRGAGAARGGLRVIRAAPALPRSPSGLTAFSAPSQCASTTATGPRALLSMSTDGATATNTIRMKIHASL